MFDKNGSSTLEIFNIGKKYKNRPVLRNVSLNVRRGEAVGLLGPNGAGKTTCFYCVTGLITLTSLQAHEEQAKPPAQKFLPRL